MANAADHRTTLVGMEGTSKTALVLIANILPPVDDPDQTYSVVANVTMDGSLEWDVVHEIDAWLTEMSRSPGGRLFAVSMDGELYTSQGANWTSQNLGCPNGLTAVWAAADDEVFAGGLDGERVRLQGKNLTVAKDEATRRINAIHGTGPDNVYAVGDEGALFHFDGKQWTELDSPTNHHLLAVLCRAKDEIYIAGMEGILYRSDGTDWERLISPKLLLSSLAWFRNSLYVAASDQGIWRLRPKGLEKAADKIVTKLVTIEDMLYGLGTTLIVQHNGKTWLGADADM